MRSDVISNSARDFSSAHAAPEFRRDSSSRAIWLFAALVVSAVTFAGVAGAQTPQMGNDIVVDQQTGLVFVMNPEGGVDGVDLASGNVRWHTDDVQRPLAAKDGQLLAQAAPARPGALTLAMLDAEGRIVHKTSTDLPSGVAAKIDDDLRGSFSVAATATASGFDVSWEAITTPGRGALILDDAGAPQRSAGSLAVDAGTGVIATRAAPSSPVSANVLVPAAQRLSGAGQQFFSASREQILVSARLEDPAVGGPTYSWTLYSTDGSRLGQLDTLTSYSPFVVTDTTVLFLTQPHAWRDGDEVKGEPLSLRAVSLASGIEQWSLPVRDTTYRGPFPP